MRILHLGAGNLFGGVETLLVTLAASRTLCPLLTQEFGVCFDGRLERELSATGARTHVFGAVRFRSPWTILRARHALRQLLHSRRYDYVICHSGWLLAVFGSTVRAARVPLAAWVHAIANGSHWVDRWAARILTERVICNSGFTASHWMKSRPGTRPAIVYCPVQELRKAAGAGEVLRTMNVPPGCPVILQAARLEPGKGQLVLVEALALLRDQPWVCWLAGDDAGPGGQAYSRQVRSLASRLGLESRVRFLGPRRDLGDLLGVCDVFCHPHTGPETFGIVLVEAMAAGVPVITSSLGGSQEIVGRDGGILVPPDDAEALAGALDGLLNSPSERLRLGLRGQELSHRFRSPEQTLQELTAALAEGAVA